jgi:anti-sigma regulatory factor (Ser/Thr protein kinase)
MNRVCSVFLPTDPAIAQEIRFGTASECRDLSFIDRHTTTNGNHDHGRDFTTLDHGPVMIRGQVGSELSVRFDRGPTAASAARNALLALEPRVDGPVLDDIRLLVSELVTNAVRHAGGPPGGEVALDVSIDAPSVRVEVADPGGGFSPQPRDDEMSRPGGWGLYLVDRIADRWGVARNHTNRVWFELDGAAV